MNTICRKLSFDLNEPIDIADSDGEVNPDESQTPTDLPEESQNQVKLASNLPVVGTTFLTENEAYNFYNKYARSVGFSIRKDDMTRRANNVISRRVFCCSKEGTQRKHKRGTPLKARALRRTNCMARIVIKLHGDANYCVTEFVEEHNHELAPPSQVHMLRSQRKVEQSQVEMMETMVSAGIRPTNIFKYISGEAGGSKNLNFTQVDCKNQLGRMRSNFLKKGDAQELNDYFVLKQKENPNFFYSIQTNDDDQLSSCFWCDAKSRVDYSFFGDVICFDTTFKTNDYDMPFAPFVGVNNHGQTILFGGALLGNQKATTFVWLFKTFLAAMDGKMPQTIFTDQDAAIALAIEEVLVGVHHRLCIWHIYQNAAKNLSSVFEKFTEFAKHFKSCIYDNECEEEFNLRWTWMLQKYKLEQNGWLKDLFDIRHKWAQVYGREHFCAGMTTTQRSESINSYFKKYFKSTMCLRFFINEYEKAVSSQRSNELVEDFDTRQTEPKLKSRWQAEAKAAKKYTRKAFSIFQNEYLCCLNLFEELVCENGTTSTYTVSSVEGFRSRTVTFDSLNSAIKCSCKKIEFMGFLCAHALKVLIRRKFRDLPSQYYLNRWTRDATSGVVFDAHGQTVLIDRCPSLTLRYSELAHIALTLAVKGASTPRYSAFAKGVLTRALDDMDCFMHSNPNEVTPVKSMNHDVASPNIVQKIVRNPPRKKAKGGNRRIKSALEKGKSQNKNKQPQGTSRKSGRNSLGVLKPTSSVPRTPTIPVSPQLSITQHRNTGSNTQGFFQLMGQASSSHRASSSSMNLNSLPIAANNYGAYWGSQTSF